MYSNQATAKRAAFELALLLGLGAALWLSGFSALCGRVRADTLRLHVVANSDSSEDQALKLRVRDAVLARAGEAFGNASDKASALAAAGENLELFRRAAEEAVAASGLEQAVEVKLVRMRFGTTAYDSFTLPAGEYDALRIELGEAKGHNWFCVLYPALCLPAAQKKSYSSEAETDLITGNYKVGFALVNWWENR